MSPQWLDRRRAVLVAVGLVALLALGLARQPAPLPVPSAPGAGYADADLYRDIAARVAAGGDYYATAVALQSAHGYPTSPVMVVRLPTLTLLQVALGETGCTALLVVLGLTGLAALAVRLDREGFPRAEWFAAVLLLALNLSVLAVPRMSFFAEAWAGALIVLAICLHRERRWWPAVLIGFAAVCFRELAVPFLLVMAVLAWRRRRRETLAWLGALAAFAVLYAVHALAVRAAQPAAPLTSAGWLQFGGWPFVLTCLASSSVLWTLPAAVVALVTPFALLGWLFAGRLGVTVAAVSGLFAAALTLVGRPDNNYWGLLFAALLLTGLAFAPRGVVQLVGALRGRPSPPSLTPSAEPDSRSALQ